MVAHCTHGQRRPLSRGQYLLDYELLGETVLRPITACLRRLYDYVNHVMSEHSMSVIAYSVSLSVLSVNLVPTFEYKFLCNSAK